MNSLALLEQRVLKDLEVMAHPARAWVPPRRHPEGHHVYDVVIVGAGQNGLAACIALRREDVTNVLVIDQAPAGREGPWVTYARMDTLRTVKELIGPDAGLPSLAFRSWYEAQYGADGWARLVRIPREMWMDYLDWLRRLLRLPVRNDCRLTGLAPDGDLIRLDVEQDGRPSVLIARKVVLATGMEGSGGLSLPHDLADPLPRQLWAHTAEPIDFAALAGRRVGILGAGASAFDNALTALEAGAAEARLFARRAELPRVNFMRGIEFAGFLRHYADLDDGWRWRFMRRVYDLPVPPPQHTVERALAQPGFHLHLGCPWLETRAEAKSGDGAVAVRTPAGWRRFDFVIFGTGFFMDIRRRPELAAIADDIALWRDRYAPPPGEEQALLAGLPYLGPGFELMEKRPGTAPHLRHIHFYGIAATPSMGPTASGLNGMKYGLTRLVDGLCRSLFVEDVERHYRAYVDYDTPELTMPPAAPSPAAAEA